MNRYRLVHCSHKTAYAYNSAYLLCMFRLKNHTVSINTNMQNRAYTYGIRANERMY